MGKIITISEQDIYRLVESSLNTILNEGYSNNSSYIDWDSVDTITFECNYYEDELEDAIESGEIENTDEGINEWMGWNLEFEICFMGEDGETLGYRDLFRDDLESEIPEEYAEMILNEYNSDPKINAEYRIDDVSYKMADMCDDIDDACKRMFRTSTEYCKGMHGYVLKDGTIILMPNGGDHNSITCIKGVNSKWEFVEQGNPSILNNNLRVGGELTSEQQAVIGKMIRSYSDDELYVSFFGGKHGEQSCRYSHPNYQRVFADIIRYYRDGMIPRGDGF